MPCRAVPCVPYGRRVGVRYQQPEEASEGQAFLFFLRYRLILIFFCSSIGLVEITHSSLKAFLMFIRPLRSHRRMMNRGNCRQKGSCLYRSHGRYLHATLTLRMEAKMHDYVRYVPHSGLTTAGLQPGKAPLCLHSRDSHSLATRAGKRHPNLTTVLSLLHLCLDNRLPCYLCSLTFAIHHLSNLYLSIFSPMPSLHLPASQQPRPKCISTSSTQQSPSSPSSPASLHLPQLIRPQSPRMQSFSPK